MQATTVTTDVAVTKPIEAEPLKLQKRIGSTAYTVNVRFCATSAETAEDKVLRLIEREVRHYD